MKKIILDTTGVKENFSFICEGDNKKEDYCFCSCGERFTVEPVKNNGVLEQLNANTLESEVAVVNEIDDDLMEDFAGIFKDAKLSENEDVVCPNCKKNFVSDENKNRVALEDSFFFSGYKNEETETDLIFYYSKIKPKMMFDSMNMQTIDFIEEYRYVKFNKKENTLYFKDFKDEIEREFELNEVISIVDRFFTTDVDIVSNIMEVHMFMNNLAGSIQDIKGIDIINGLLENARGMANQKDSTLAVKKVISILFSLIKYSNLSTIAMTKGPVFLYDLMCQCDIPTSKELEEEGATSPIKIFNHLIQNFVKKLNNEIEEDDKSSYEFEYKSKKRIVYEEGKEGDEVDVEMVDTKSLDALEKKDASEVEYEVTEGDEKSMKLEFKHNNKYIHGNYKVVDGKHQVMETVADGTVSKFIYKNITNFSDYRQLIKYLKLVNKKELIVLLNDYEVKFLIEVIDLVYFVDIINFKELRQLLDIIHSYVHTKSCEIAPNLNGVEMIWETAKNFPFYFYNDALLLIELLGFSKKRHFSKIKDFNDLVEYHDNIVIFTNLAMEPTEKDTPEEAAEKVENKRKFEEFIEKYMFLENRSDYDGPLEIEIHKTPGRMITEGREMSHSGYAYTPRVARREYLMGSVYDKSSDRPEGDPDRFTVGFKIDQYGFLVFNELKGKYNKFSTDRVKNMFMDFMIKKDISFQANADLKMRDEDKKDAYQSK